MTNAKFARQDVVAVRSGGGNQSGQAQTARPTAPKTLTNFAQNTVPGTDIAYLPTDNHKTGFSPHLFLI